MPKRRNDSDIGLEDISLDQLTFYMLRTDMEGNYTYVNKKFVDEYGWLYPKSSFIGKHSLTSICEYDHARVHEAVRECALEPGKIVKIEIDKPWHDGNVRTTIWDFVCLTDTDGHPSEIQCMGIDITDRMQAERTLKESVERLDSLAFITAEFLRREDWHDVLHDVFELAGRTTRADRVYLFENHQSDDTGEILSSIRVEWVSDGISAEIDNPMLKDMPQWQHTDYMATLKRNMPYQALTKNVGGNEFRASLESQGIVSILLIPVMVDGKFYGFIGVDDCHSERVWSDGEITFYRNIASSLSMSINRYNNLQQIKQWNERFRIVSSATNDAIWDYEIAKGRMYRGMGFTTLFGYESGIFETELPSLIDLVHPDDRTRIEERLESMFDPKNSETNWSVEYRLKRADGTYAYVDENAVFIRNSRGEVVRAVGATSDISHRYEYEESLRKLNQELERNVRELALSNQDLEQFAYVTSHDLQEPLRMVSSFMTLLEKKYADQLDDKALQYIHFATDGAKKMRQIILDLLDFSKMGTYEGPHVLVPLNDTVKESLALFRRIISEKKAIIHVGDLPIVSCHPTPISQVFQNLISNALTYNRKGVPPEVSIHAIEHPKEYEVIVTDNGIGISHEYHEKVFVIFQRLNADAEYPGTGIGLSLVKKVIDRMGGRIWVESEEGNGSAFHFTIPKVSDKA